MIKEELSTLNIHRLTQQQYKKALANGNINDNEIYLTQESLNTVAEGDYSYAGGKETVARGESSIAFGIQTETYTTGSSAVGMETCAGGKMFNVVSGNSIVDDNGLYQLTLDSVEGISEVLAQLSENEVLYVSINKVDSYTYDYVAAIKSVDEQTNTIKIDNYVPEQYADQVEGNILWIPGHPELGTFSRPYPAHAEGYKTIAQNFMAHAEGYNTQASGKYSHAEGQGTRAGYNGHAEGKNTLAKGSSTHAEGAVTKAIGANSHAEGCESKSVGINSHAEGHNTIAEGVGSHAEGTTTQAIGKYSHTEGDRAIAKGDCAHAEGINTRAEGEASHAEGYLTSASGGRAHAEGSSTKATGIVSHAEGGGTTASGYASHAEGQNSVSKGASSHAGGQGASANRTGSFAHGQKVTADADYQTVFGTYNEVNTKAGFIIGNGDSDENKKNAFEINKDGDAFVEGQLYIGGTGANQSTAKEVATIEQLNKKADIEQLNKKADIKQLDSKVNVSDIVNNLITNVTNKPLGADQGVVLKELIDSLRSDVDYSFSAMSDDLYKKADKTHTHDDRYYTESEIDTMLANLDSDSNHTHTEYMSNADPVGTGSFSMNRKADTVIGTKSHAEGSDTEASGNCSHAEGYATTASGICSHAEGDSTIASNFHSHAEGYYTTASGDCSHAEGSSLFDDDGGISAQTTASGYSSHAEGLGTTASGEASHAEGCKTTASGNMSHAEGNGTTAGHGCHAEGYGTTAITNQHVQGHWNNTSNMVMAGVSGTSGTAFVIGNGTTKNSRSNAFRVDYSGEVYAASSSINTGADYAEFFEWQDANPNVEDRRGYFVTLDGEQIRIAQPNDYILGIVSGQPAVIGNGDEDWRGRYILDEFGAFIIEEFQYEEKVFDKETGETNTVIKTGTKYKENPEYDPSLPYVQRKDRPEWDAVGMVGVLSVRDDGTCKVNGFCKVAEGGIATASESGYRVIKRVSDNIIKVIFK